MKFYSKHHTLKLSKEFLPILVWITFKVSTLNRKAVFFIFLLSSDMVLDQQVSSGQLNEDVRHRVHEALMKQHHHQNQKKLTNRIPIVRSFADIGKKQSEPNSMDKNGKSSFISFIGL